MALSVEELVVRLNAEATRRGITTDQLVDELAGQLPASGRRKLGFVSLGASTTGRRARDAEEILAEGFGAS